MANVDVVKSGNSLKVNFGQYSTHPKISSTKRSYHVDNLTEIDLKDSHVLVYMGVTQEFWKLTNDATYSGNEFFIIDSIDAVQPVSLDDLYEKLTALRV